MQQHFPRTRSVPPNICKAPCASLCILWCLMDFFLWICPVLFLNHVASAMAGGREGCCALSHLLVFIPDLPVSPHPPQLHRSLPCDPSCLFSMPKSPGPSPPPRPVQKPLIIPSPFSVHFPALLYPRDGGGGGGRARNAHRPGLTRE